MDLSEQRVELIKDYLSRLGKGETLEKVQKDFVREFSSVDSSEIIKAEQRLLADGTPLSEVQKLCDVHSALFHSVKVNTGVADIDDTVKTGLMLNKDNGDKYTNKLEIAGKLANIDGHPVNVFKKENEKLQELISQAMKAVEERNISDELINRLKDISVHYAKKGDLIYPLLKTKYGIAGPSDVMWTVDDEIRDELSKLIKSSEHDEKWYEEFRNVIKRAEDMIYKEDNILFPNCAVNFNEKEWMGIYHDSKDYRCCFGMDNVKWNEAEEYNHVMNFDDEVVMPGGHMTVEQLTALLNTLPFEITFIDSDNINRYFNEGPKAFKRPLMALDREVFSCHPPKIEPMVRGIINDFRTGKRDRVNVWSNKDGREMLVSYMAVRDRNNKYVGTIEIVQDMEYAREHFCTD